jgi:hypothetical protein
MATAKVKVRCVNCGVEFETFVLFQFQKYYVECFCSDECCLEFTSKQRENWEHLTNPETSEDWKG